MLWAYAQAVKFPLDEGLVLREAGLSVAPAWRESSHTCDGLDADTLYTRALPPVSVVDDVLARRSSHAVFMGTSWEAMAGDAGTHDGGSASAFTGAGGAGAGDGSAAHAAVLPPDWVEADGSVLVRHAFARRWQPCTLTTRGRRRRFLCRKCPSLVEA